MLPSNSFFFFEKWYFDAQQDDGTFLFTYFAPVTLFGKRNVELVICLFPPPKTELPSQSLRRSFVFPAREVEFSEDRRSMRFDNGQLDVGPDLYRFVFSHGDVELDIRHEPLEAPWIPPDNGLLFQRKKGQLLWQVPVPRAHTKASVKIGTEEAQIDGYGYHDFVQTNIPPWRLSLRELLWGRALGPEAGVIWNLPQFKTKSGMLSVPRGWVKLPDNSVVSMDEMTYSFEEIEEHSHTNGVYPSKLLIEMSSREGLQIPIVLDQTRLLLGEAVVDVQSFNNRFERWLHRTFSGNPIEYKLFSRASLKASGKPMLAAHEWVLWGGAKPREAHVLSSSPI